MGYWATSLSGGSLQFVGDPNPDGTEMLWGDAPADRIDAGLDALIRRLAADLGRHPTVDGQALPRTPRAGDRCNYCGVEDGDGNWLVPDGDRGVVVRGLPVSRYLR